MLGRQWITCRRTLSSRQVCTDGTPATCCDVMHGSARVLCINITLSCMLCGMVQPQQHSLKQSCFDETAFVSNELKIKNKSALRLFWFTLIDLSEMPIGC